MGSKINKSFVNNVTKCKCPVCNLFLIPVYHSSGIYLAKCPSEKNHKFEIGPYITPTTIIKKLEK